MSFANNILLLLVAACTMVNTNPFLLVSSNSAFYKNVCPLTVEFKIDINEWISDVDGAICCGIWTFSKEFIWN